MALHRNGSDNSNTTTTATATATAAARMDSDVSFTDFQEGNMVKIDPSVSREIAAGRKAKDDFIGGRDFSRVRRFDDNARKARIFASNAGIAVDVKKLEQQLKEKEDQRNFEKMLKEEAEKQEDCERERWNREDKELRSQRVQERSALEEYWRKQDEEFKERWKHKTAELIEGYVGIIPAKRYQFQDEECLRDAEENRRVCNVRDWQVERHNARLHQELEDKKDQDMKDDLARKRWEREHEEIVKKLRSMNMDMANEYLRQFYEKCSRDKRNHDEEHHYEISKAFFEQFNTTSR